MFSMSIMPDKRKFTKAIEKKPFIAKEKDDFRSKVMKIIKQPIKKETKKQVKPKKKVEEWVNLGTFKITAYGSDCVGCGGLTFSGTVPQKGRTIAVDPNIIPLGSEVKFDGQVYIAEDTGGAIKGNIIDLFYGSESESEQYGVQWHEVYIRKGK